MSREALVLLVCCCDFRDGAERLIPSKSLRNAVIRAFPGLFRILRMCAPRRAAAVVRPRGREKSADRRRRILISRLLIIRTSVPRRKSPFPAYFKGFPAVSPLIPPYPAFLKYPVSPHKSEKMLDISLIDKDLEQLAGILNQYNDNQRQLIASTLRHENYLKESIANISHDLRTPLTVILGHLQLLRKETLTDKQEQRIETIFHKAERMKELVQTFYDLSILDAEQITPRREDFNLSNLLINLITENAPALEAKNISPEIDLPPHSVYLNSDYSMVERILQNLLTNAIRYSSGDIKMGLKQTRKNRAIFTIENPIDSKTEINPARLFERFYTGDASRHNSGTGVGLAVVKLLTDKLGGNVSAEIKSNVLTVTLEIQ